MPRTQGLCRHSSGNSPPERKRSKYSASSATRYVSSVSRRKADDVNEAKYSASPSSEITGDPLQKFPGDLDGGLSPRKVHLSRQLAVADRVPLDHVRSSVGCVDCRARAVPTRSVDPGQPHGATLFPAGFGISCYDVSSCRPLKTSTYVFSI